jgi:hypothetical protein
VLTLGQLAELRSIIGPDEPPSDVDLSDAYDRLASVPAVALEVQRARLATLRSRPAILTIDGDRTENWSATIASLERHVTSLEAGIALEVQPSTGMVSVSTFTRAGRGR